MNLLDTIIIIIMIFFIVKALLRGPIRELASLVGVILGIWLANDFQLQMTNYLKLYLPSTRFLPLISFVVIFASVLIIANFSGWVLKLLFTKKLLGWSGRTLGAVFAIMKGVIIIFLSFVLLTFFLPAKTPLIANSKLAPWIIVSYQSMIRLISPDHYQKWKEMIMGKKMVMDGIIFSEKIEDIAKKDG